MLDILVTIGLRSLIDPVICIEVFILILLLPFLLSMLDFTCLMNPVFERLQIIEPLLVLVQMATDNITWDPHQQHE